jgi:hypothetical protein
LDKLFVDLVTRTVLIVTITDTVIFYRLMKQPDLLTTKFVAEVIIVTIIPLVISLWFVILYQKIT